MNEGMTRRQKLTVSIVGVTLILLTLLGITYAYYLTRIEGNTNENSISITTAKLELLYADGNGELTFTSIMPGTDLTSKTFTVTNNGNSSVNEYAVSLEEVTNTLTRTEDLTYTLTCTQKSSTGTIIGECNSTSGEYPKTNQMIVTNSIEVGYTHEYELKVTYANLTTVDQSIDMGSTIKGKVQIYGLTDTIDLKGTVSNYTDGDYVQINSETKTSKIVNNEYTLVGIKPGTHTIKVCSKVDTYCTEPSYENKIVINKGSSASVGETTVNGDTVPLITITNESQVVRINIDITSTSLDVNSTVSNYNPFDEGTLAYNVYQNKALVEEYDTNGNSLGTKLNKDIKSLPLVTSISDGTNIEDSGLFIGADDYGTSYFYRGTVRNNYVSFAGFTWRIIRINGDNSVRLILDGSLEKVCRDDNPTLCTLGKFDDGAMDNISVGYTYGQSGGTNYDTTHKYTGNKTGSDKTGQSKAKQIVDEFYETYLTTFNSYLSDTLFCGDKGIANSAIGDSNTGLGYGNNVTYYKATERLFLNDQDKTLETAYPTLKCASDNTLTEEQRAYSRYTVNGNDINGLKTNNYLRYPIALISADEIVYAGAFTSKGNSNFYLSNNISTLSMTPYGYIKSPLINFPSVFQIDTNGKFHGGGGVMNAVGISPVINISKNILVDSGNGTTLSPYVLKLAS